MRTSGGAPCVHMVVEAADPCGPLRMARSCFLGYGCKPDHLFKGGQLQQAWCMLMPGMLHASSDTASCAWHTFC